MSKPKRKLFGTSENLLKGEIALSNFSHSSGIKGVLTVKILGGGTADLSVVPCGAAEGTRMVSFATGGLGATQCAVPSETVSFPRPIGL